MLTFNKEHQKTRYGDNIMLHVAALSPTNILCSTSNLYCFLKTSGSTEHPALLFNMMPGHMLATQYLHKELYHPDLLLAAQYESETYHNKQPNILWKDFCHCVILSWQRTIFQDSCATTKTKPATCTKFGLSNVVLRQIASISRFRPPTPILKLQSITAWLA